MKTLSSLEQGAITGGTSQRATDLIIGAFVISGFIVYHDSVKYDMKEQAAAGRRQVFSEEFNEGWEQH